MTRSTVLLPVGKSILLCSILAASQMSLAQNVPNAGELLQQQQQPILENKPTTSALPKASLPNALQGEQKVWVKAFRFQGNTLFSEQVLQQKINALTNQELSLTQLQYALDQINNFYAEQGYSYSFAFFPEQNLSSGIVTIQLVETLLSGVNLDNQTNTQPWLLSQILAPLQNKQYLSDQHLNLATSRLALLHGVSQEISLARGAEHNTTQVNVQLSSAQKLSTYIGADNVGGEYTGEVRGRAGLRLYQLAGLGDELSLDVMSSGSGLNYGQVGYNFFVNGYGTQVGASHSYLTYTLQKELKAAGYEGIAAESSVWLKQHLNTGENSQAALGIVLTHKQLEDDVRTVQSENHRRIQSAQLNLNYYGSDSIWGGGVNSLSTSLNFGHLDLKSADVKEVDTLTRKTQGEYTTMQVNATRSQKITDANQLFVSLTGFYSPENLDSAEAFYVGGPSFMRGYKNSTVSGSQAISASVELSQSLWSSAENRVNGTVFVDAAKLKLNASTWRGFNSKNDISLSSAGVGVNWNNRWVGQLQAQVGFPLGDRPIQMAERDDHQVWMSWQKAF